ncbi:tail fiber domain-containing protein, partial [bacterium]|nr:tail fiber domain-containing protein [bacterium]
SVRYMPAGFADGVDDTGHFEANTIDTNIAYWADIRNVPAGLADGDDIDTNIAYWANIRNVPAGLDDGDDIGFVRLRSDGDPWLYDSATFVTGSNITLTQNGDSIIITAADQTDDHWDRNGNYVYTFNNTDSVGIGTTNPAEKLDVSGNVHVSGKFISGSSVTIDGTGGAEGLITESHGEISFDDENLTTTGDISANNITVAGFQLTVSPTNGYVLTSDASGNGSWTAPSTLPGDNEWLLSGSDLYPGNTSWDVGIGLTNPGDKLDVNGHINSSESYKLDGITVLSNAGNSNIFVGKGSGLGITPGSYNSALGDSALSSNSSGVCNTAVGSRALYSNGGGDYNTAIGVAALPDNTSGEYNTAIGNTSLYKTTDGNNNTGVGVGTLHENTAGISNTAIGFEAGYSNQEGDRNVFIGYRAGYSETGDDRLYIENSNSDSPLIWGEFDNNRVVINGNSGSNGSNRTLFVNGEAGGTGSWHVDSDKRLKKNINTISNALARVEQLRGVQFEWEDTKHHAEGKHIGFIAQEVLPILPEVVDRPGEYFGMQYAPITAVLVEAIKEQQDEIKSLMKQLEEQKDLNDELRERLERIESTLELDVE